MVPLAVNAAPVTTSDPRILRLLWPGFGNVMVKLLSVETSPLGNKMTPPCAVNPPHGFHTFVTSDTSYVKAMSDEALAQEALLKLMTILDAAPTSTDGTAYVPGFLVALVNVKRVATF